MWPSEPHWNQCLVNSKAGRYLLEVVIAIKPPSWPEQGQQETQLLSQRAVLIQTAYQLSWGAGGCGGGSRGSNPWLWLEWSSLGLSGKEVPV